MENNIDVIDCFGDICPLPVLKIENKMKQIKAGDEIMIVTDHSCTLESIRQKFKEKVTRIDEVMNGVWEVYIKK